MINNPSSQPLNLLDYESLASQHLSQMAFDYYASGAWDEVWTLDKIEAKKERD
jgi:4-hydroxymandelate oxidase